MVSFFTPDQHAKIERRISTAIGIQSDTFGKPMNAGKEQADAMVAAIATHNQELHRSVDSVRRLVEEANEKAEAINDSIAGIAETEARLAQFTNAIDAFATTQDSVIEDQTISLEREAQE